LKNWFEIWPKRRPGIKGISWPFNGNLPIPGLSRIIPNLCLKRGFKRKEGINSPGIKGKN